MMTTATEVLCAMESAARSASVQELRLMICNTLLLRPGLGADDREYADVLLLKLQYLVGDQQACSRPPVQAFRFTRRSDTWLNSPIKGGR
jgi:hypothetical protein